MISMDPMEITIGVVMDYPIPGIIEGAGAYARQHGLRIDARWSVRADWMPEDLIWHGVMVNLIDMQNAYLRLNGLHLPMVHLGGWLGEQARPRVEPDYAECGRLAAEEFQRIGCRKVAAMPGGSHSINQRSYRGLRLAVRDAGLEWVTLPRWRSGREWTRDIGMISKTIVTGGLPCGVFIPHAGIAMSLVDHLISSGVRVPDDVALIVIDKDFQKTAELSPVPLTGVLLDEWQQGYEAAAILHKMIQGDGDLTRIVRVPVAGLCRRASTGMLRSNDPLVAKALHVIREFPLHELEISRLVNLVGASRRTLEQRFRKALGDTLHEVITRRRVEESKRILRTGDLPIAEVAGQCGYSSVHYFTAAFRKKCGITPGRYRTTHRR